MRRELFTSEKQDWGTPAPVFRWLHDQFRFTVDLAADAQNAKLERFFSLEDNALKLHWDGERGFLNPEYAGVFTWLKKSRAECLHFGALVVHLVPSRTDTKWFRTCVMHEDGAAGKLLSNWFDQVGRVFWFRWQALMTGFTFLPYRLNFEGEARARGQSAPFPSLVFWHFTPGTPRPVEVKPGKTWESGPMLTGGWPRGILGGAMPAGRRARGAASSPAASRARLSLAANGRTS